ncbi:MAG TPA: glutamine--fructose-6-phosphate transaminase (isomerizing) [Candidatus Woesearchaeota archaeon]|nr:glutamine--fructose-6-phosphate transaminase (isomerizing) [Candidatus Woesearchaeota archaeon]
MCGIIGYIGKKNAVPLVIEGIKKLEYRGYDSVGFAVKTEQGIIIKKGVGKVDEVLSKLDFSEISGNTAVAHSRWATHGSVTQENAHPQMSSKGDIVVVHNGIIENYQALKQDLTNKGCTFTSETDTEVIPNLIQNEMDSGKEYIESVKSALKKLEGSYALLILNKNNNILIGARKESPLVVGFTEDGWFFASDIPSFLEHTKKVIYLHDGDLVIANDVFKIYNLDTGLEVKRKIATVEWDAEQAKKGVFEHFMMKEISEQAAIISNAVTQDMSKIKNVAETIKKARGVYFIACGSSYNACLSASYKFAKLAKVHVNVALASEFENYKDFLTPESLIIAVSQSGETADVLSAVKAAKEKKSRIISIINVMGSSLVRESDEFIMQNAGPEICVLATKSYTSQLVILTLLAYALADKLDYGVSKIKETVNHIYYLTSENTRNYIKDLAERLRYANHIYSIGRGLQYPTALEAALKIKEVSYIHAEGFAGGELKHGTIAMIEHGTPCIVFTSRETEKQIISNALELKARGAYIIGIGPNNNEVFDFFIKVREAEEANSICQIIPIQILAYQLAILRGCDPDYPKNLAKVVTVL